LEGLEKALIAAETVSVALEEVSQAGLFPEGTDLNGAIFLGDVIKSKGKMKVDADFLDFNNDG